MSGIATAIGGSAILGYMGASDAADQQSEAANAARDQQQAMFDTQNKQLAPQRATGYSGLNNINSMLSGEYQAYDANGNPTVFNTGSGYLTHQFNNEDLNANLAPNYDFQLKQGQQSNQYANNATGGLVGGNAMKSMQDYTQNFAGNAYQNAFNNYQGQRSNIYNTLASIAGFGQTANQTGAQLSANTAHAMSSLGVGAANAQAAGTIGATNAITGGIQSLGNMNYLSNLINPSAGSNLYSNSVPSYFGNGAGAPAAYSNAPAVVVA